MQFIATRLGIGCLRLGSVPVFRFGVSDFSIVGDYFGSDVGSGVDIGISRFGFLPEYCWYLFDLVWFSGLLDRFRVDGTGSYSLAVMRDYLDDCGYCRVFDLRGRRGLVWRRERYGRLGFGIGLGRYEAGRVVYRRVRFGPFVRHLLSFGEYLRCWGGEEVYRLGGFGEMCCGMGGEVDESVCPVLRRRRKASGCVDDGKVAE